MVSKGGRGRSRGTPAQSRKLVSKPARPRSGSVRIPAPQEAGSDPFQVAEPLEAHGESGP